MYKFIFCFFLSFTSWSQKLHHQIITSQGISSQSTNDIIVLQSVGQVNAVIGNFINSKLIIQQGYIQSPNRIKNNSLFKEAGLMIVYPNPIINNVIFKFSHEISDNAVLYLFDSTGKLAYQQLTEPKENSFTYDLSLISEGVYFAKIETSKHTFSTKIIKTK